MNLELIKKLPLAKDIITFYFHKPSGIRYNSGEYIEISLDFNNADKRGNRHWFTLSSSPTEKFLSITTRFPEGMSTFKQHLEKLGIGTKVQISPPMGDFILPHKRSQKIVFVAGGIGITPFRSMLRYIYDAKESWSIQLIYSARTPDDFIFIDLFKKIPALELIQVASEPTKTWNGESGKLDIPKVEKLAGGLKDKLIYFSGPEPMVETLDKDLKQHGHPENLIKTDFFPGYTNI